jgi:hypothetical protein
METSTDASFRSGRALTAIPQTMLAVWVLLLAVVSFWAFLNGIEPRPIAGADRPHVVSAAAAICIGAWGYLIVYLFRGMSRRHLSSGWCPILLAGAFAIVLLFLACFGHWAGV